MLKAQALFAMIDNSRHMRQRCIFAKPTMPASFTLRYAASKSIQSVLLFLTVEKVLIATMNPDSHQDPRSDSELIHALNRGDISAFDAIYYRYRDWVVALAHRFTASEPDALDVLQETFVYFYRKFPGFRLTARLTTFFYPVVKNLSLAAKRKRRSPLANHVVDQLADPNAETRGNPREELAAVLTGLPELYRETILMRFVDGMSLEEIAIALEIPLGTVKSRLHNGLMALREDPRVRDYFFGTEGS